MVAEIDLVASLLAYSAGRAQRRATHRQVVIQPGALVLCPIAMSGEDTTIHAVALGSLGQPPAIYSVPDPRQRDDQFGLFEQLHERIERSFQSCLDQGVHPQLWVSSGAGAGHLDVLAERFCHSRQSPFVRRLGELLSYATDRTPIAGQQALLTATGALRAHWATGQQPGEDEHLGALLAWIDPPAGVPVQHAVARAELTPMGARTDPAFDRDVLEPLVAAYNQSRRAGASPAALAVKARAVHTVLAPVVQRIYDATQRAIALLQAMNLPPLPDLAHLERRETDEFQSFMRSRDEGYPVTLRDKPKAAVFKLSAREDAEQNASAALLRGDRLARARGRLAGDVVLGTVSDLTSVRAGARKIEHHLVLRSAQRALHVRRRDSLCWVEDPRLRFTVTDVQRRGSTTHLALIITAGQRAVGLPEAGAELELLPGVPDWSWLIRQRMHLRDRLRTTPWTHNPDATPMSGPTRTVPPDPLAAVEALR